MKKQREGGFLISKIHHLMNRVFARKLQEHGIHEINPAQGRIMFVLWQNDGIPITELARQTSLDKSTLTSMLDRLEEAGFVARVPALEDRRKVLVKRTEKDKAWQKVYVQVSQEMTRLFYDGFAASEMDEFEQYLRRILENLTASDSA
jgi:DNA-binding MarR family transcriptional regulator